MPRLPPLDTGQPGSVDGGLPLLPADRERYHGNVSKMLICAGTWSPGQSAGGRGKRRDGTITMLRGEECNHYEIRIVVRVMIRA